MNRKILTIFIVIAFFVGALGSLFFDRLVFPRLSTVPGFAWVGKLRSSAPIVISRREEVRLNEGVNLIELTKQAQTTVVSIYSAATQKFLGNGIIITSDGVIFTTKDVVGNNGQVKIVTNDGTVYPASVRAMDPKSPIAVVTITAQNLPVAQFSDAGSMQTAQRVFALGKTNVAFTRVFASGLIIKTLSNNTDPDRILTTEAFENTIATDADLNADFIGGPVVNLQGTFVGMVIGPAGQILPAEAIDGAVKSYLSSGKISRPYIGMTYHMITSNEAKIRNLPSSGAVVVNVAANSPAAQSGLIANDMILQVNGQLTENSSLEQLLVASNGNEVKLLIRRGAEQKELTLKPEIR